MRVQRHRLLVSTYIHNLGWRAFVVLLVSFVFLVAFVVSHVARVYVVHISPLLVAVFDNRRLILRLDAKLCIAVFQHGSSRGSLFVRQFRWLRVEVVLAQERLWDGAVDKASGFAEDIVAAQVADIHKNFLPVFRQNLSKIRLINSLQNQKSCWFVRNNVIRSVSVGTLNIISRRDLRYFFRAFINKVELSLGAVFFERVCLI